MLAYAAAEFGVLVGYGLRLGMGGGHGGRAAKPLDGLLLALESPD